MLPIRVRDALAGTTHGTGPVRVRGWVRTRRDSKRGFSFIQVHDGSCLSAIQVVADEGLDNYESEIKRLTTGCAVCVAGVVVESPGRGQRRELRAESVEVIGWVDDPDTYPVAAKRHTFEHLREVAHLRPRTSTIGAVARVRHVLAGAAHEYLTGQGFVWINTPLITASDCEGAGELFRVTTLDPLDPPRDARGAVDFSRDFFGREAFLTVSGQLNLECYCLALSKVYTFGPTFRAENSNTSRHLAEFWMIEPELAFADLNDNADLAESFLKAIIRAVLEQCPQEAAFFDERVGGVIERLEGVMRSRFERIDYGEAIDILARAKRSFEFPGAVGLGSAVGARAIPHRGTHRTAGGGDELPEGHQGFLHAPERRRRDGGRHGRARAGHGRDHRRQRRARNAWRSSTGVWTRQGCASSSGGTGICAATAACRTWVSDSAWNAPSATSPA